MLVRRNIYEQQRHNRVLIAGLLIGFVLLLGLVGLGLDVFYLGTPTPWNPRARGSAFPLATFVAVGVASASA